jgi:cytochrome c biogenesis protein CcmG/thiol:disulfide interchange protein DsbE
VGDGDIKLVDFRGKPMLLNFFASWCEPCRDELPLLQRTAAKGRAAVLGVLFRDSPSNARKFLHEIGVTLPAVEDDGGIARAYRVDFKPGLPMSFLISKDGVVLARHIGQLRSGDVDDLLKKARN